MRNHSLRLLFLTIACLCTGTAQAATPGAVVAWGHNGYGQTTVPVAAQSGVTAIAAGLYHTVALKNAGSVVAWGWNDDGQTNVPVAAQSSVTSIAAGRYDTLALKNDGSVVAWGGNRFGITTVPVAAQSGVTAIAAGLYHSVALKNDGSVVVWGNDEFGQATVPATAQSGVTAIAAGEYHTVALKNDGSVVAWGRSGEGQTTVPPAAQSGVVAVAAGAFHSVILRNDGAVVVWGWNGSGQTNVPVAARSGVIAIAAGYSHTVVLKNDGSVVAWGDNYYGETNVPGTAQSGVTAIAAGGSHTLALVIPTAPVIITPPVSQTVNTGRRPSFTVAATGIYLNYQWRKNGTNLPDATNGTFRVENASISDAGSYTVVVGNSVGSVTSAPAAVLTVNPAPPVAVVERVQRYHGPTNSNDAATAVAVDGSGNVVVTGHSFNGTNADYYTAKYAAADGALLWEKRYNDTVDQDDYAVAVAVDSSGNVVVTGQSEYKDYYTAKYAAADGALLWEKRNNDAYGSPTALAVDASGNVVVVGHSQGNGYTAKYAAADGALLWEKFILGPDSDNIATANAVAVDASGNVVVTGYIMDDENRSSSYTAKYEAADGSSLWENGFGYRSRSESVALDSSGNVVVTGWYYSAFFTAKYEATTGALLWEVIFGVAGSGTAVAVDGAGNVVITGRSSNGTNDDFYTAKYAALDGALLWDQRYNGPANGNDAASAVAVDASGDVLVTGISHNGTNDDYYTAKYGGSDGALLWEKRYNGPANGNDVVGSRRCLALGPNGMVAITGSSQGSFGSDFATVVYRENLPAVSIVRVPTGVRLRFPGVAGHSYQVLRAPAVTGPWSTNATLTAATNGLIEHLDTNAPPGSAFYRTATAP